MDLFLWRRERVISVMLAVLCQWYLERLNSKYDTLENVLSVLTRKGDVLNMLKEDGEMKMANGIKFNMQCWIDGITVRLLALLFTQLFALFSSKLFTCFDIRQVLGKNEVTKFLGGHNYLRTPHDAMVFPSSFNLYMQCKMEQESAKDFLEFEWERYGSFKTFPMDCVMMPTRLAQAGFYYTGLGQEVRCFCCGMTNRDWTTDETAIEVHKRMSPNCAFILGEGSNNRPIYPEDEIQHPEYVRHDRRIMSFDKSANHWVQGVSNLASAGFFYTGEGDAVKCFYCGVHLGQWKKEDDPWTEHARWSPSCKLLLYRRGEEFTSIVTQLPIPAIPVPITGPEVNTFITKEKKCQTLEAELQETQEKFKQYTECKICRDKEANVVFIPCGHLTCEQCASRLKHGPCPHCRRTISGYVRKYHT